MKNSFSNNFSQKNANEKKCFTITNDSEFIRQNVATYRKNNSILISSVVTIFFKKFARLGIVAVIIDTPSKYTYVDQML